MTTPRRTKLRIKDVVVVVIFTIASAAFSIIKLPGPVGSIALDSFPGFFSALYFSPLLGGIIGCLGHLASAATGGFPLGLAHFLVALTMFWWCFLFGYIARTVDRLWALVISSLVAIVLNAVGSPLILALVFPQFRTALSGLIFYLFIAATVNVVLAALVF